MKNPVPVKLGTQPAMVQFRYKYRFRIGLRVTYRALDRLYTERGEWQYGIITKTEPMLFITKM